MHIKTSDQEPFEMGFGDYTCNLGLHICGLYNTEKERDEIIFGFLHAGVLHHDQQFYCPAERSAEDFSATFGNLFPECRHHLSDPESFYITTPESLYYRNGRFSPMDMEKRLNTFYTDTIKKGKRTIRAAAEMVWALKKDIPGVEHLMVYESRLNYFIPGKPWISICLYNITKFSGSMIMNVLRTHPFSISGGVITRNPFYQDPDDWLRLNYPQFLINPETDESGQ